MIRRVACIAVAATACGALCVCSALTGCTSFAFKQRHRGSAPDALQSTVPMVAVGPLDFTMGWQTGEPDEFPPHRVSLSKFLVDRTEVVQKDYAACVDAHVCAARAFAEPEAPVDETPVHPVVGVSWFDAKKYCEWVGKRLPTEAEWEAAARTPSFGPYPWAGRFDAARVNGMGGEDGFAKTAPVGSFPAGATASGILDMAGNAAEWTADFYDSTTYQKSPAKNPTGPEVSTGSKVVRGGSWADADYRLRSTSRLGVEPNVSSDGIGFRCAKGG